MLTLKIYPFDMHRRRLWGRLEFVSKSVIKRGSWNYLSDSLTASQSQGAAACPAAGLDHDDAGVIETRVESLEGDMRCKVHRMVGATHLHQGASSFLR